MSVARILGVVTTGLTGVPVVVEVDVASGLPSVGMVGLAGASVSESRWRVRSAVSNIGLRWPAARITIGLSPADLPKTGTGLDLPIAVGILVATDQIPERPAARSAFIGELGLDGSVHPVPDALSAAIAASRHGIEEIHLPAANAAQATAVPGLRVVAIRDLAHLVLVLRGLSGGAQVRAVEPVMATVDAPDLIDVRGHAMARFGLEVAASGGHHVAITGPPGIGKSMLGARFATLLPDLDDDAALEVTSLLSIAGQLPPGHGLVRRPVTQAPHHAISAGAFLGSATTSRILPGAVTRAHHGVLFMDEAPEFNRSCLEGLRQPLESGVMTIARVGAAARLPARFQLVVTANPCPCGNNIGRGEHCRCSQLEKRRYADRLSGPLMDRIDVRLLVGRPTPSELDDLAAEDSASVRARVVLARARARERFADESWSLNAAIPSRALQGPYAPTASGRDLLRRTLASGSLRGSDRVLRMAWTIADLQGEERPGAEEVATALGLRGAELAGAA